MSRLYLVDAHAYLHRAYHALPPLTNSKGDPVGALYGFARMLLMLLKRERPEQVAVCFDAPGPTFRHRAYKEYKATRKEIDPDLLVQLKSSREVAEAMGFTCVELSGYEADDLMATLARRAVREGREAVLVTADKDVLQMVGPGIRVLKDVAGGIWMDCPQIEEKLGVPPRAVADYLALTGDSADNVPGVPGIGPVGASKLLKRYGDLPGVLHAARSGDAAIPAKTLKALLEAQESVQKALCLLRLEEDAPISVAPSDCCYPQPRPELLCAVFGRLEFDSLLKEMLSGTAASQRILEAPLRRISVWPAAAQPQSPQHSLSAAFQEVPFEELKADLSCSPTFSVVALRQEVNDLLGSSRAFLALGLGSGRVRSQKAALAKILSGKALKSAYDLKEVFWALDLMGLSLSEPLFDAMLASYCLSPVRPKPEKGKAWRERLLERTAKALGFEGLRRQMEGASVLRLFEDVELPLARILWEMEREGIALDGAYLKELSAEFASEISALQSELEAMAGLAFNPNSPKQLGELLFDTLSLPVVHKTAKGGRSTDEEALKVLALRHPIPAKVLDYRELSKLKSTFIDGLLLRLDPRTARVYTHFDQTGTETGRLSSLNPNLQNIPIRTPAGQKIRRAFVARSGYWLVSADYSQIDLRVLAHASGDKVLREAFSRNEDIHLRTACEVFGVPAESVDQEMRRRAKAVNFGIVYGQTAFGLSGELGIGQAEAADIIRRYFERYHGVAAWFEKNLESARREGLVRTFLGRVRHLPDLAAKNTALRQFSERAARNTPIQGGSADIIKLAMIAVHRGIKEKCFKARMLLQIHDELLFEVPRGEVSKFGQWVSGVMERAAALSVPLAAELKAGSNWRDMKVLRV
jgi:DNA polymerase-1